MKAPVGLLSDRTVLRQQDGGASPRQVRVCAAQRSNESPSGAFKRPNGLAVSKMEGPRPDKFAFVEAAARKNYGLKQAYANGKAASTVAPFFGIHRAG